MIQSETKCSLPDHLKELLEILSLFAGILFGLASGMVLLWLWLDYQSNPAASLMTTLSTQLAMLFPATVQAYLLQQISVMGLPLSGDTSAYWYMARAGGVVAYGLMWLSVVWGLLLSTKVMGRRLAAQAAYGFHEFVSILGLIFAGLHALVLLGDSYIDFRFWHLLVPFSAPYEPFWTGLGTIAWILSAAIILSFYVRKQIGQKLWRKLHYLTFLVFIMTLAHGIMAGTDSHTWGMIIFYWGTGFSVLFLIYYRLLTLKSSLLKKASPAVHKG